MEEQSQQLLEIIKKIDNLSFNLRDIKLRERADLLLEDFFNSISISLLKISRERTEDLYKAIKIFKGPSGKKHMVDSEFTMKSEGWKEIATFNSLNEAVEFYTHCWNKYEAQQKERRKKTVSFSIPFDEVNIGGRDFTLRYQNVRFSPGENLRDVWINYFDPETAGGNPELVDIEISDEQAETLRPLFLEKGYNGFGCRCRWENHGRFHRRATGRGI